ncbi:hypothetical protein A3H89_02665 [Candidatus Amesbacteria bacterium RIFCSPLOWO2_02_FULL_48_11]|nr:MAG: hypothetical protein A3H89_02665 [Candidatus Amesbacteria bacterium RIFCSPLOWO2_02_FULL_48_11]
MTVFWIMIITFLVHASYTAGGFVWLDHGDIETGRSIAGLSEAAGLFIKGFGSTGFYRPIVSLVNSSDKWLYGNRPWGWHLTNVILHTMVTGAVYFFCRSFFRVNKKIATTAALIFGVHTLSWLPAGAISYRPELLAAGFTLLTVLCHIRGKALWSCIFLALALMSKESAFVWTIGLIGFWTIRERVTTGKKLWLAEAGVILTYLLVRWIAVGRIWPGLKINLDWSESIGTRAWVIGRQFLYLVSPVRPPLSDTTPILPIMNTGVVLVIAGLLVSVILAAKRGLNSLGTQILIFVGIALIPATNLIPLPRFNSPHYAYLAAVGAGMAGGIAWQRRKVFRIILTVWLAAAAVSTFRGGFLLINDLTLFEPEVRRDENYREGLFYLGDYHLKRGDYELAGRYYEKALSPTPRYIAYADETSLLVNMAAVKIAQGKHVEAEELLIKAISGRDTADLNIVYNLALVFWERGEYQKAVILLSEYQGLWQRPEPMVLLAKAYLKTGKPGEAAQALKRAVVFLEGGQKKQIEELIGEIESSLEEW